MDDFLPTLPPTDEVIVTVTELTGQGFRYARPLRPIKLGLRGVVPECGILTGGECRRQGGYAFHVETEKEVG